jgi:hypothetical protein
VGFDAPLQTLGNAGQGAGKPGGGRRHDQGGFGLAGQGFNGSGVGSVTGCGEFLARYGQEALRTAGGDSIGGRFDFSAEEADGEGCPLDPAP